MKKNINDLNQTSKLLQNVYKQFKKTFKIFDEKLFLEIKYEDSNKFFDIGKQEKIVKEYIFCATNHQYIDQNCVSQL